MSAFNFKMVAERFNHRGKTSKRISIARTGAVAVVVRTEGMA